MPISRYEIRNEYSLADPELYRAADKDDPEAMLEGVAMAGLVGVLRQLGDLAEFAADIFHNLHEDVMATASRGHVLAVRVQQLEAEIPSVERAFLSQTDHSSFFYHPGIDWHPNLQPYKNIVTQGDLPRFVMNSYEECRAPPRLFLLDKFDVAGAGACLKRYTDPSFFKVDTSGMTTADTQREKKIRKTKKKTLRWKNRGTPDTLPTSHAKLHQLFLEERIENGVSTPRHAKLKRRLNGFPFNLKSGKSYMEDILKSPSPDHEVPHDMTEDSPQLKLATNAQKEFSSDVFVFRPMSPNRESRERKSIHSSPDIEDVALHHPIYDPDEYPMDNKIFEVSSSHPSIATDVISFNLEKVTDAKVVAAVDTDANGEGSLTGFESDGMASEIDNYVDAPSTMESEMDRDYDWRMKNDDTSDKKMELLIEEPLLSRSPDSQSTEDSTMSDGGNNSSTKEISSFTSDSPDISAEISQSKSFSSRGFQCSRIPVTMIANASSCQETGDKGFPVDHSRPLDSDDTCTLTDAITNDRSSEPDQAVRRCLLKPPVSDEKVSTLDVKEEKTYQVSGTSLVVSDGTCPEINTITNQGSEFEQVTSTLCINGSMPTSEVSDPKESLGNFKLEAPGPYEMVSSLVDLEKINLVLDPPCSPSAALGVQTGGDLSRSSAGEELLEEPNGEKKPCFSAEHNYHHNPDSSVKTSSNLLHEDEFDAACTLNMPNVHSTNGTLDTMSSGNQSPGDFEDEFPEEPENFLSDYFDAANNGDNIEPIEDNLIGMWGDDQSNVSTDSSNILPYIREASLGKGTEGTSLVSACTLNVEDNYSSSSIDYQISSENQNLSHLANSPDRPMDGYDVHEGDIIPVDENIPPGIPEPFEAVGLRGTLISHHVSPDDSEALERLHSTLKDLEEPAGTSDTVEMNGISMYSVSNAQEVIEITSSADLRPANEIHILLNQYGSMADGSKSVDTTSLVHAVSDYASLSKLVEEHNDCFDDSSLDELENDNSCPSECHAKLGLVEKMGPTESSASGSGIIDCNSDDNDHPKTELSGLVPYSHLDSEDDHRSEFIHAEKIQSPTEQCGLGREQELLKESSLENHVPDAPSLPVDNDTEESVQDNIGLPPSLLDQNLLHPVEISSELSPLSPINYLQILDDDGKGHGNLVSAFSHANGSSPPFSELSRLSNNEINVPGHPKDSISLESNIYLEANQINLADLPPLPPLPPVQWRMGKLQHAFPFAEEEEPIRNEDPFPQLISRTAPTDVVDSTVSTKPTTHAGASLPIDSTNGIISLREEMNDSPTEPSTETTSKEENLDSSCSSSDAETLYGTIDHPPKIENKPLLLDTPISESVSTSSAAEDGAANGSQKVKFPRLRNPLVDDVSFLDKSKLRKVTERVRPKIQKVEERDSLLEQIRTKSFNLRPALASRPSIRDRGPNTNLKVVAILEKANAIRQAFAGSDEDDDDSWSE